MTHDIQDLLNRLQALQTASGSSTAAARDTWIEAINKNKIFLENRAHSIVFIGSIGAGKSSLISVVSNLLVGSAPNDRKSLKENSVLAIGSGRTTVCDVYIRAPRDDEQQVGLLINPFSEEEMEDIIQGYAEDEWNRQQANTVGTGDPDPTPIELQRAIRKMTDYAERREIYPKDKKINYVRPIEEIVSQFKTHDALVAHLIERANLPSRKTEEWWLDSLTTENLKELKTRFDAINQGNEPTAMLPHNITVVVPNPLPGSRSELQLTLIDSRGLDGLFETRGDLQELLRNPRTVIVLCTAFKEAPGDTMRAILRSMSDDGTLRMAIPRIVMVLLDQGDSDQVNGAEGNREFGQILKINECCAVLEGIDLYKVIDPEQVIAFDVLQDNRKNLVTALDNSLTRLRKNIEEQQEDLLTTVRSFLQHIHDENRLPLCNEVDQKLREAMEPHLPTHAPMQDPMLGAHNAINNCRYASALYAACRRNGSYRNLDLYAAVNAEASRAATKWLDRLIKACTQELNNLEGNTSLQPVLDHIHLRKRQFEESRLNVIHDYAKRVKNNVEEILKPDNSVWTLCKEEWGHGRGFIQHVADHLKSWSQKQQQLTAHENTNAEDTIPLLKEVLQQVQPPRFSLHVRHLRSLRQINWSPEPLSILIGANGAGKTTLLLVLKLLRVAYELDLSQAIARVLGGSFNLRTWNISEGDTLELGIDIGDICWRIQFIHRGASVEPTHERLMDQSREIFSRDGLSISSFSYGGEWIGPNSKLGVRVLMDRGSYDPALRTIASFLQRIYVYHDPDLWSVRTQGSNSTDNLLLNPRGTNVLAVLRRWFQERTNQNRYQFVLEGLQAAFPNTVANIDFQEAGNTIVLRIFPPNSDMPCLLADEATGVAHLLILLCNVASAEDGGLVAADEPENSLHPYAIRAFFRRTKRWAAQHNLTVLLATHSMVLLNESTKTPECVYIMKSSASDEPMPFCVDKLNREWLEDFNLGELYDQGEIGSNKDGV